MTRLRVFLVALSAQLVLVTLLGSFWRETAYHFREDRLVENLSAGFFLVAALVAAGQLWRRAESPRLMGLCAVAGVVGFLDELSFGERLFSLSMPTVFGIQVDAVHDLFEVAARLARRAGREVAFLSLAAVVGVVAYVGWRTRDRWDGWRRLLRESPRHSTFVVFLALLAAAIGLDVLPVLGFEPPITLAMAEEILELNAAVCLLLVALPWTPRRP